MRPVAVAPHCVMRGTTGGLSMVMREHTAAVRHPAAVLLSETELCGRVTCLVSHDGRSADKAAQ